MSPTVEHGQQDRLGLVLDGLRAFGLASLVLCLFLIPALGGSIPWGLLPFLIICFAPGRADIRRRLGRRLTLKELLIGVLSFLCVSQFVIVAHLIAGYWLSVPASVLVAVLVVRWMRGGQQQLESGNEPGSMVE